MSLYGMVCINWNQGIGEFYGYKWNDSDIFRRTIFQYWNTFLYLKNTQIWPRNLASILYIWMYLSLLHYSIIHYASQNHINKLEQENCKASFIEAFLFCRFKYENYSVLNHLF